MWDLIVSVPDHCLSFYFDTKTVPTVDKLCRYTHNLYRLYIQYSVLVDYFLLPVSDSSPSYRLLIQMPIKYLVSD